MNDRDRLLELLIERSLEIRPVTLSSGRKSDYYIDCKRVTLSPEGAYLTAKLMLEQIHPCCPELIHAGQIDPCGSDWPIPSRLYLRQEA